MSLRADLERLPPESLVPVGWVLGHLDPEPAAAPPADVEPEPASWQERIWTAHPEARIGVREVAEALGRSPDYVYRHTSPKAGDDRLPHRKVGGENVFVVGEVRGWIQRHEDIIHVPPGKLTG